MDDEELKMIASQLSCPSGETAVDLGKRMSNTNAFMIDRCIEMLAVKPSERIAEIGLGNGVQSIPLIESLGEHGNYIGIELSTEMAQEASKQLRHVKLAQVAIHNCDYRGAPIEAGTLDGLLAINLLAFIFGFVALGQIRNNPGQSGRGLAIAGIILSIVWTAVVVAFFVAASENT